MRSTQDKRGPEETLGADGPSMAPSVRQQQHAASAQGGPNERSSERLLLAISRVQSLFIDDAEAETVFDVMLRELLTLTGSEYGFIGEVLFDTTQQPYLRTHAITDLAWNEETRALKTRQVPNLEFGNLKTLFGHVMTTGQVVISNDPLHDPHAGGLPTGHPSMHAFLGVPIHRSQGLIGMVGVANRPGGYDETVVADLEPFLATCAQLMDGYRQRRLRAEAETALRESEDRFRAAVQGANEGIWDWNLKTNGVYFSPRWKAMLGYEDHEIAPAYGEWESRLHPDDRDGTLATLNRCLTGKAERYDVEFRLRKKNGDYCWIHACGSLRYGPDGCPVRMVGSHEDITERRQEEALQKAEKQALELVAKGSTLTDVLLFICRAVETQTMPMLCSIMLVAEDGLHLSLIAGPSFPEEYNRAISRIPIGPTVGSCGSAAYFRKPVIASNIETDPLWKDYASAAARYGLRACWSLPILGPTDKLLGTLAVYHREPRAPQPTDLKILARASSIAALAIEHAKMTEALRESEARFEAFSTYSPAASFIKDPEGRFLYVNPKFEQMFGVPLNELCGRTLDGLLPSEIVTKLQVNDEQVLISGRPIEAEETIPTVDGEIRHWLVLKFPLISPSGERLLGGTAIDITERRKLERANQDYTDRLRLATDIAGLATWDWNILTDQVVWSENCEEVKGLPRGSFDGTFQAYHRFVHPEDLPRLLADIECALSNQKPYHTEHRIVPPTGEMQWVEGNGVVYRDELGRPIRMVGTVRNITERKRIEQAMRVNEERYARATAVGRVGVWELDVRAGTYYGDANLKAMLGYRDEELSTDPYVWLGIVHPDDQQMAMAYWQRIVSREIDGYYYELRMIRKDGTVIWTDIRGHAVRTADGQLTHVIGATLDITGRKQAEESLRRTQFAMDQAVDAVYWIDPQARILYTNDAAGMMLGYTAEEFLQMTVHDLNPDFPPERWPGWWEETREKKVISMETVHLTKDGRRVPVDIRVSFLAYGGHEFHCAFVRDISKRKEVEEAAYRSFSLLQSVLHTAPIRVFWKDRASRFLGCNQQLALDAGCADAAEIIGKTDDDLVWHEQAALYQADDRQVMESGRDKLNFDEPGTTRDGKQIWLRTSKVPLRDEQGAVIGVLGVYEDITERKRIDSALRESQERFELAVRASNDGIWDWNILTGAQYWSDHHFELFGLRPGDITPTYDMWISLVHPDDAGLARQSACRHLDTHEPYDIEVRVRMKDGSYRWFRDRGQAVWDESGRPVRMVGSISDVTERRKAEETIWKAHAELEQRVAERTKQLATANRALELEIIERKRVEDRLQRTQYAVDHAADQIFVIDKNGHFLDVNEAACRRLGYTKEELLTMAVADIDPDCPREVWDICWTELRQSEQLRLERRHRSKSGEVYPIEVMANYLCHGGQRLVCAFVRDISERKRAEGKIRESELRYKLVTEATFDAIALHDNGILFEVNAGLERMFGYEPGELLGRSILNLIADESREQVHLNMRNGMTGPYEAVGRRKDGTTFPSELVVRPYCYRGKEVRLVAGRDITARKQLERQLARHAEVLERQVAERTAEIAKLEAQRAQTQKLAAVGQMAAAIAHEINNPIAGIRNAFILVKQAVDQTHPHYEFVGMIDREISWVATIVQNMYQLYRKEPSKAESVDLQLLLRDLEAVFTKRLSQFGMTLVVTQVPLRAKLLVPQSDLLQVLMNLIQNAIDSSPQGGMIRLNVSQDAENIMISVSDEGSGISLEVLPHIFDPFFTTKTEKGQKGMGLGLSVSQSLVMAMGGRIEVQTELGTGSTFSIVLPQPEVVNHASAQRNIIKEVLTNET